MARRWSLWVVVGVGALVLSACGASNGAGRTPTAGGSGAIDAAGSDVNAAAGCWTANDRVAGKGADVGRKQYSKAPAMTIDVNKTYRATIETSAGTIEAELDPTDAPVTVNNFVCLARDGYFDNTPVHRIVSGFVIQGGDPTGTGTGSPGYRFNDEPVKKDYTKGTLAMANSGPNTNGSQFFITTADLTGRLPKNYTIFGQVVNGMDVVDKLDKTPVRRGPSGENSSPIDPVTINKVTITES